MTILDFCKLYHITIWAANRLGEQRWRITVRWTDGSRHQMTLTVRSKGRPSAPAILRRMIEEAKVFEADPARLDLWDVQRKLMRFLGEELYNVALSCIE